MEWKNRSESASRSFDERAAFESIFRHKNILKYGAIIFSPEFY